MYCLSWNFGYFDMFEVGVNVSFVLNNLVNGLPEVQRVHGEDFKFRNQGVS